MRFFIRPVHVEPESFDVYNYEIVDWPRFVARYWHDHRGDEHGIDFALGLIESCHVGKKTEFLTGDGPQPLGLSDAAIAYLEAKLSTL